jgi:hypothetical protein
MSYHVRGCKVAHHEFVLALLEYLGDFLCHTVDAHLRVFVVGGDLGRGDHVSFLVLELLLHAAVEEECDVCVLFSL